MNRSTLAQVAPLLREVAQRLIAPRWLRLQAGDASEKTPGEWVTVVDREVEEALSIGLSRLIPASLVVGEEQCAATPQLLDRIDDGIVWLVDPLDGTGNFIAGRTPVSSMVALLDNGVTVAAWMLDPLTGTLHHATRGGGAWRNDQMIVAAQQPDELHRGIVKTRFLPEALKHHIAAAGSALELQPGSNCAGADYPDVVLARSDFALYWRVLPWDHAPGALFAAEAGGFVARLDGREYRPGEQAPGLLVARSRSLWDKARRMMPT